MMDANVTKERAERLLALHHAPELLVLPNVWDPLGARLLEHCGYPAVATASAAVAWSLGYDDGQLIRYDTLLGVVRRIAASVTLPVTADIERGYAEDLGELEANIAALLAAGAVGLNIEDSLAAGGALRPADEQCRRLQAVRRAADAAGVPLVINGRTDVFLSAGDRSPAETLGEAIERGKAYLDAGADCIYPIGLADLGRLTELRQALDAPINVYASAHAPSIAELETAGIARLSLGPGFLRAAFSKMQEVATGLRRGGSYDAFTKDVPVDIGSLVSREPE